MDDPNYGFAQAQQSDPLFRVRQIGLTHAIENINAIDAIKAEIFRGAGNIEISANGIGKSGSQGLTGITFEGIDNEQRQAIRELARINEVNLTTHSTFQVGNLSGLGQRGFSEQQRKNGIDEIKKAIDFSAEAANGGSVVVHTNEFPRAIGISQDEGGFLGGKYEFEAFEGEAKEAQYYLVNKKSGDIIKSVKADEVVFRPKFEYEADGVTRRYLKDENDNPIYDDVIKLDLIEQYKSEHPESINLDENQIWDRVDVKRKEDAKVFVFAEDNGNILTERIDFTAFKEEKKKQGIKDNAKIVQDFFKEQMYGQIQQSLGQSRQIEQQYKQGLRTYQEVQSELKQLLELKKELSEQQWKAIAQTTAEKYVGRRTKDIDDPLDVLRAVMSDAEKGMLYGREAGTSGRKQAREILRQINEAQIIGDYALEKTKKSIAELGIYAIQQTEWMKHNRPSDKVKPITITLENIYPEQGFGAHPQELKKIVEIGREALKEELMKKQNRSESEAKKLAEQTVKITLDTGHLNIWRKFFKAKDGESKEDTDARFKEWFTKEVEDLAKGGYIGNMHIADNLGWDDSHLAAGQGNAPIRRVLEILNKYGYSDVVTSEGGFGRGPSGEFGLQQTWKMAGASQFSTYGGRTMGDEAWTSPSLGGSNRMYGIMEGYGGSPSDSGYFRDITRPQFIFKGYAPDSEDWRPWSGTGME
jgi:hypothetical protein